MNILTLCLSRGLGGLELYALRSAANLAQTDTVLMVCKPGSRLFRRALDAGLRAIEMEPHFKPFPVFSALRLARLIEAEKIDVIHMHWGKDLPLAALAVKLSRHKPALVYTRQMQITRNKTDLYHQFLYHELDLMLTITEQLRQRCAEMLGANNSGKVMTFYYGVNAPDHFFNADEKTHGREGLGIPENAFVVGLIGRLEDQKGQHLLIRAIAKLKTEGIIIHAVIVGHEMQPGYRDTLRSLAQQLGASDQILFQDFVDQPQDIMQLCDCVLLATYMETFGLVLPEAMRAGIAVIGSNAGGVPEIIEHEVSGLLFNPKDVDDLKTQIAHLKADPDLRHRLTLQGKQKADDIFNSDKHFERLHSMLSQLVSTGKIDI